MTMAYIIVYREIFRDKFSTDNDKSTISSEKVCVKDIIMHHSYGFKLKILIGQMLLPTSIAHIYMEMYNLSIPYTMGSSVGINSEFPITDNYPYLSALRQYLQYPDPLNIQLHMDKQIKHGNSSSGICLMLASGVITRV